MAKKFLSLAVAVKLRRSQQSPVTMTLAFDFKKMPKNSGSDSGLRLAPAGCARFGAPLVDPGHQPTAL
jgi:hypothetical protein